MDGNDMTSLRPERAGDTRRRLRILLSAYACEPHKGSEPGIGWNWAAALAHAGHDVWVLTRANNRGAIEGALADKPVPNLRFVYYDLPVWARWWKRRGRGVRLYYVLWQWGAYQLARRLCRELRFDLVHHITFGVFRHPSFMAFLDVPFIFGPVGGGESAPRQLRGTFPLRGYLIDLARDFANWAVRLDPLMTAVYRRSVATLCKTHETLARIPEKYRDKCLVQVEVGTDDALPACHRERKDGCFQVLYVGRLIYWKGLHLGLMAFAKFSETHPDARLTIIGSGPDELWLRRLAHRLGLTDNVTWIPWLERAMVMRAYPRHDVFLFPSLHDSSGNAVLEALSCGLPVVCLDVGGPALLVDASCGFRVPARKPKPEEVVTGLAQALAKLAQEPELMRSMGAAAAQRVHEHFSWTRQAARMEHLYLALQVGRPLCEYGMRPPVERGVG
jgi:glycosyltransferase involved in cell wall biosynthesis